VTGEFEIVAAINADRKWMDSKNICGSLGSEGHTPEPWTQQSNAQYEI
jgi:hypothetical protein